jgi:replicative DNA helicase
LGRIHAHEGEVAQLLDEVTRDILAVSEADGPSVAVMPVQHYVKQALDAVEQHVQGRKLMLGLSTGINYLDNMTSGLQPHQLWLLCGRPGGGKTSLAMQIGTFVAVDLRQPVGVFSLEMDGVTLALRELCGRGQSSFQAFRNGFCDEQMGRRLVIAAHAFGRDVDKGLPPAPLYIDESDELFCEDLERRVEQMHREHGIKVFVIDYLQLLEGRRGFRYSGENLVMAMSHVSSSLMKLKKRLPITLVVAAQENTNREKAERTRPPLLSDLADGQGAAKAADLVAFLDDVNLAHIERDLRQTKDQDKRDAAEAQMQWLRSAPVMALPEELRGDDKHKDTYWKNHLKRTNLHIAKQRNGPTGACQLVMVKPWMRFIDVRVTQEEAVRRAGQGSRRGETAAQEKMRLLDEAADEMGAGEVSGAR